MRRFLALLRSDARDVAGLALGLALVPLALCWTLPILGVDALVEDALYFVALPGLLAFFGVPVAATLVAGSTGSSLDLRWTCSVGFKTRFFSKLCVGCALCLGFLVWSLFCLHPLVLIRWGSEGHGPSWAELSRSLVRHRIELTIALSVALGLVAFAATLAAYLRQSLYATLSIAAAGVVSYIVLEAVSLEDRWARAGLAKPNSVLPDWVLWAVPAGVLLALALGSYLAWRPAKASTKTVGRAWLLGIGPLGLFVPMTWAGGGPKLTHWRDFGLFDDDVEIAMAEPDPSGKTILIQYRTKSFRRGAREIVFKAASYDLSTGAWNEFDSIQPPYFVRGWDDEGRLWFTKALEGQESYWAACIDPLDPGSIEEFDLDGNARPWGDDNPRLRLSEYPTPNGRLGDIAGHELGDGHATWVSSELDPPLEVVWPRLERTTHSDKVHPPVGRPTNGAIELLDIESRTIRTLLPPGDTSLGRPQFGYSHGGRWILAMTPESMDEQRLWSWTLRLWDHRDSLEPHSAWRVTSPDLGKRILRGSPNESALVANTPAGWKLIHIDEGASVPLEGIELGTRDYGELLPCPWMLQDGRVLLASKKRVLLYGPDGGSRRVLIDLDDPAAELSPVGGVSR